MEFGIRMCHADNELHKKVDNGRIRTSKEGKN